MSELVQSLVPWSLIISSILIGQESKEQPTEYSYSLKEGRKEVF